MGKKTKNLELPIITPADYATTKVTDMIDGIQGDHLDSAFNVIDNAVGVLDETKQDKITVNPSATATDTVNKLTIDGTTYQVSTVVDSTISGTSTNPVQNKVIYQALQDRPSTNDVQVMINDAVLTALNSNY